MFVVYLSEVSVSPHSSLSTPKLKKNKTKQTLTFLVVFGYDL